MRDLWHEGSVPLKRFDLKVLPVVTCFSQARVPNEPSFKSWLRTCVTSVDVMKPRYVRLLSVANGQARGAKKPDKGQQVLPVNIKTLHRLKEAHRMSAANRRKELPGRPSDIQSLHFAQLQA